MAKYDEHFAPVPVEPQMGAYVRFMGGADDSPCEEEEEEKEEEDEIDLYMECVEEDFPEFNNLDDHNMDDNDVHDDNVDDDDIDYVDDDDVDYVDDDDVDDYDVDDDDIDYVDVDDVDVDDDDVDVDDDDVVDVDDDDADYDDVVDVDDDDLDDSKAPLPALMRPGPSMFWDDDDDDYEGGFPARCHWPEGRPVSYRDGVFFYKPVREVNDRYYWNVAIKDGDIVHRVHNNEVDEWGGRGGRWEGTGRWLGWRRERRWGETWWRWLGRGGEEVGHHDTTNTVTNTTYYGGWLVPGSSQASWTTWYLLRPVW